MLFACPSNVMSGSADISITQSCSQSSQLYTSYSQMGQMGGSFCNTNSIKCPLCLENDVSYISLKCGHVICCNNVDCIRYFEFVSQQTRKCPFCREPLNDDISLYPIKLINNSIKCTRCKKKGVRRLREECVAKYVLECGHLGYCDKCHDECKCDENPLCICYECNTRKRILCNVYF